jgi:hypothetical protein
MNLLDLYEQREPYQQAIDKLEQRRIKDLEEKLDYLKQAYAKADTDEIRTAIKKRYNDIMAERDSYYTIKEADKPQQPQKGQDVVDREAKMKALQPAKPGMMGAVKDVVGGIKRFVKGEPDQGPTYEAQDLEEQELGRRGIGIRNMKALQSTIEQGLARTEFQFADGHRVFIDEEDSDKLADYYNALDSATRGNFVYNVLSDPSKFIALAKSLGIIPTPVAAKQPELPGIPTQGELPLSERRSQKKKFKDTIAQRELEKARAEYPSAGSDLEAFVKKSLDTDQRQDSVIQDLEGQVQSLKQPTAKPTIAPAATATVPPAVAKTPTPAVTPTPGRVTPQAQPQPQLPSTTPEPTAEPAPVPANVPKKDKKILSRVKNIEKRLRDRVDAYQTDRVLRDKTPGQLAAMQQQIDNLNSQLAQQKEKLSRPTKLALGQDDVWDVEANLVKPAFTSISKQPEAVTEGRMKQALDDYKMVSDKEFQNKYKMTKNDFYRGVINPQTRNKPYTAPKSCPQCGRDHESCVCESDEQLVEGIRDTASATAVVACLLAGGSLQGCATAPQQMTTAQAVKTGQDVGRIIYNAKRITRAGTEEEARQELKNIARGMSGQPQELNNSNILRIWRQVNQPKQQNEAKEIATRDDFIRERDRLLRMISMETNPANKQILKSAIRQLENRAEQEGWLTIQQRMIREDTAALAAEDAILKRIFVKHRNLMMEYGPEKITQAAESVAYNVGDIAHITDEQIAEWVGQVEYILGARP